MIKTLPNKITTIFCIMLRFAKIIRPVLGPRCCRFSPSCLNYAHESLSRHGLIKGVLLSVRRIFKCHPWHHGGYDPVPKKFR